MKKYLLLTLVLLATASLSLSAQGRRGLRINEVMVENNTNFVDDYGQHNAWIELFNTTYAPLEISSVYLTNDKNNPTKYPVPLGDVNTKLPKRQHVVFWADDQPTRGTFHLNFQLTPGQDNWIGVYDADGKTLIDEVVIPASLLPDQSYARKADGEGEGADAWEVRSDDGMHGYITPSSANRIKDTNNKVAMFSEMDEHGFGMAIMAMAIVFTALLVLCISFYIISKIGASVSRKNKAIATAQSASTDVPAAVADTTHDSGEAIAAIVMALHEHLNAHDNESTILTINKVKRAYSPWSSKIYSLRELPRH